MSLNHMDMFAPKTSRSGLTGPTCGSHQSDWCGKSSQNAIWTSPLDSSRRVDQDSYIEHLICTLYESDVPSRSSALRVDRSDRCPLPRVRVKSRSPNRLGL
jgi:hypothetical protein